MTEGDRHDFFRLSIATIGNQKISKPFTDHRPSMVADGSPWPWCPQTIEYCLGYSSLMLMVTHWQAPHLRLPFFIPCHIRETPCCRHHLSSPFPHPIAMSSFLLERSMRWVSRGERRVRIIPMTTTSNGIIIRPGLLAIQRRRLRL